VARPETSPVSGGGEALAVRPLRLGFQRGEVHGRATSDYGGSNGS
jgi:hypothetical protein